MVHDQRDLRGPVAVTPELLQELEELPPFAMQEGDYAALVNGSCPQGGVVISRRDGTIVVFMTTDLYELLLEK